MNRTISKSKDYVFLVIGFIFLLIRAKYGYSFYDEPHILSLGMRLYNGDLLYINEWYLTQNFSIILAPLYAIFHLFSESNDGILLTFRYLYCIFWYITCLFVFFTFKNNNRKAAAITFLFLILFSPLDQMTISYTSISLMCALSLACLSYIKITKNSLSDNLFSVLFSLLFVFLVFSYPNMAIIYIVLFLVAFIYHTIYHNKPAYQKSYFNIMIKSFIILLILIFIYFAVFIFVKDFSLSRIIQCLEVSFSFRKPRSFVLFAFFVEILSNSPLSSLLCAFVLFYYLIKKEYSNKLKTIIVVLSMLSLIVDLIYILSNDFYNFNANLVDFSLISFVLFAINDKRDWKMFFCFNIFGLLYSFGCYMASDTDIMAISTGLVVCGAPAVVYITNFINESQSTNDNRNNNITKLCLVLIVFVQLASQLSIRIIRTYWDEPIWKLNSTIQYGAAKGLITSNFNKEYYENNYLHLTSLLSKIQHKKEDGFLSLSFYPVNYLDANMNISSYSTWTCSFDYDSNFISSIEKKYYEINSNKIPDIIYLGNIDKYTITYDNLDDYSMINEEGYCLYYR